MPVAGAHGLALAGELAPAGPGESYVAAPAHWPTVTLRWRRHDAGAPSSHVGVDRARVPLLDGGYVEGSASR